MKGVELSSLSKLTLFTSSYFCGAIIYSLSGSMLGWTFVPLFVCLFCVLVDRKSVV